MAYGPISVKAKEMWSKFGLVDVRAFGEGFFFFSFETKEGMKKVLDYKQWKMYHNLYISKSEPRTSMTTKKPTNVCKCG